MQRQGLEIGVKGSYGERNGGVSGRRSHADRSEGREEAMMIKEARGLMEGRGMVGDGQGVHGEVQS